MLILKPSKIHGVGVFTTEAIRKGIELPLFDYGDWQDIERPVGYQRRYCTFEKGVWYAPENWNRMSIGWYLNDAGTGANVDAKKWFSLRYIKSGEELTINYLNL